VAVQRVRLLAGADGTRVRVTVADTAWTRMVGLLAHRTLPGDEGLWLSPAWSIHTWCMRFPIDVVFVDREERVLRVVESMAPWRLASERQAHAVIELAAGRARALGLVEGRRLDWSRGDAEGAETLPM
jgi:uncharacterized membrane protein (UPF0127 family)